TFIGRRSSAASGNRPGQCPSQKLLHVIACLSLRQIGQTKAGGLTWHDLRHTFATRLRGERVHELDIMQLLGHSSLGVTAGYAHGMTTVIQSAVDKLAEPRGEVVEFARRAS